ncbi:MAG TPA: protein kinase, partial [Dehalococcoidia bacterium]|nr:protein kinase [Dehalococcoidia bacterium]
PEAAIEADVGNANGGAGAFAGRELPFWIAGRYEVRRILGYGGMGAVYRAHDARLDRPVAIKTILQRHLASKQASARFFREARALARLNHPNILTLHDYGQEGDLHYLVLELGGPDLQRILDERGEGLPLDQAIRIAQGICRALAYAHSHGVIHRDLKPANVLIGPPLDDDQALPLRTPFPEAAPIVKVMDFGLAKVQGAPAVTATQVRIGTPQYMSPEQALGGTADERSDLYSLGVLLYETTTGMRPFESDDPQAVLSKHLHQTPASPSAITPVLPPALDALILSLLEKDPLKRPASAAEVLAALEAIPTGADRTVRSAGPGPHSALGRLPARAPFVGRSDELDFLKGQFEAVAAGGGGRLILVSGEPGVGKTRLVHELGLYARLRGGAFIAGHYLRDGTAPYGPWVEALRAGLRGRSVDELAAITKPYADDLARILPELADALGCCPPEATLPADTQRRRLFDGIVGALINLARDKPLVLLLDDLQWAPGLQVLLHLAWRLGPEARLLVLGTYRDQEFKEQPDLMRDWAELNRSRLATDIGLAPLAEDQTGELMAHYFGQAPAAQLWGPVYRATRGNAFFIEEVLRSLAESGAVRHTPTGWEVVDLSQVSIPESVKLAVEERVTRLGGSARSILTQAAILGQEFSFQELLAMTGLSEDDLIEEIERAVAARLLADQSIPGEERFAFADDQVQEVLYAGISAPRRRRYHLRAGQALESLYGDAPEAHLEELARHFIAANEAEKGADYSYRAGRENERFFNWAKAIPLYHTALQIWEELGGHLEQRATVAEKLGDIIWKSTLETTSGLGYYQQALTIHEQLGNRRKVATLHAQIGRELSTSANMAGIDVERALEHLHLARSILEEDGESQALAWVYTVLGASYGSLLRWGEAGQWTERAIELGERLGSPLVVANALALYGMDLARQGEIGRGTAALERSWQIAVQQRFAFALDFASFLGLWLARLRKDPQAALAWAGRIPEVRTISSLMLTRTHLIAVHTYLGEYAEANRILADLQTHLTELGQPAFGYQPGEIGLLLLRQGEWATSRRLLEDGFAWAMRAHWRLSAANAAQRLGELALADGDFPAARRHFQPVLHSYRASGDVLGLLDLLPCLVELHVGVGELSQAEAYLTEALALLEKPEDWGGLPGSIYLTEALVRATAGRWEEAEAAFRRALDVNRAFDLRWEEAKVYAEWSAALVKQAGVSGDAATFNRAEGLIGRALVIWEEMGARPRVALARRDLAALLIARGRPGDRDRALELIATVQKDARELQMDRLVEQAARLAEGTPAARPAQVAEPGAAAYPDHLTGREVQVLRLIAAGRTNKEIADELVLSVRTAERHIVNIYHKIGARGRADATAYALSRGLVPTQAP